MPGMKDFIASAVVLALALVCGSCSTENGRYVDAVLPIEGRLQQVTSETDALAASCRDRVQNGDLARAEALQDRLTKIGFDFTSLMAPPDFAGRHSGMAKGIASEATGLSALKGYCGRALQLAAAGSADAGTGPEDRPAVQKAMEGQWKYFEDNHAFFKAHLKIFSNAIKGIRK